MTAGDRASSVGELLEMSAAYFGRRAPRVVPARLYRRVVHPLLLQTADEQVTTAAAEDVIGNATEGHGCNGLRHRAKKRPDTFGASPEQRDATGDGHHRSDDQRGGDESLGERRRGRCSSKGFNASILRLLRQVASSTTSRPPNASLDQQAKTIAALEARIDDLGKEISAARANYAKAYYVIGIKMSADHSRTQNPIFNIIIIII